MMCSRVNAGQPILGAIGLAAMLALAGSPAFAAPIALGPFTFDSAEFGNALVQSDGGTWAASNWLNIVNADPGSPGYLTGANFNTGIANIGLSPVSYTIGYATPIVNGSGADFGVATAHYSTNDTITLTINGVTQNYGPGLGVSTGVSEPYFYNGTSFSPVPLFVTSIDLSDFGVSPGAGVSSITVTGSPELDLIRVAGFATNAVPTPAIGHGFAVFLAVGGLWFVAKLLERSWRGAGLFEVPNQSV
jgi:hypothetical protein